MIGQPGRKGFSTVTPYLMVKRVAPVVEFLEAAFEAREVFRTAGGAGGIHVEVQLGSARIMLGGDLPGAGQSRPAALFLYVEDTDAVYASALKAGAQSMIPPGPNFGEPRGAGVVDPFGNQWFMATHG